MSLASPGPVDRALRSLVPLLTGLAAALLDLLPLPDAAPLSLAPFLTVCVVYFWTVYRPDLLSSPAVFVIGLALDATGGLPLGLTALSLLIARGFLMSGQRFLLRQPFPVVWACFLLVVLGVAALRWLLASLFWGHAFPVEPVLFEAGLTFAVYPAIGWLLARLQRRLVAAPHAPGI
jgi:rod shape-determining protein MreD